MHFKRRGAQCRGKPHRWRRGFGKPCREIKNKARPIRFHQQGARQGVKGEGRRFAQFARQHKGGRKGRMAAHFNLGLGREPSQPPSSAFAHDKGGFGKIMLSRHGLHHRIR